MELFTLVPSILRAFWGVYSTIGKLLWTFLKTTWHVLAAFGAILVALWPHLEGLLDWVADNSGAGWAVLTDAENAFQTAMAAGWPPQLANGVAFVNAYVPLAEAVAMLMSLFTLWVICVVVRIVKSCIPTMS